MKYDDAAAERLEQVYRGADVAAQRTHVLDTLSLRPGESVIDIGSGPGFLCEDMARAVGSRGSVLGVDLSPDLIHRADARKSSAWLRYLQGDATALPAQDQTYDVMVSTQVAEYVPDIAAFCREAFRVLKPGGRGLVLATDWQALSWHSEHPERMERVMRAFAPHCAHSSLPRILAPLLRAAGFAVDRVSAFPIINIDWSEENYSCTATDFVIGYVRSEGNVAEAELTAWQEELKSLAARGAYFFMSNRVLFEVRRPE